MAAEPRRDPARPSSLRLLMLLLRVSSTEPPTRRLPVAPDTEPEFLVTLVVGRDSATMLFDVARMRGLCVGPRCARPTITTTALRQSHAHLSTPIDEADHRHSVVLVLQNSQSVMLLSWAE